MPITPSPWRSRLLRQTCWRGSPKTGAILYEMHIGTFSREGTFDGAIAKVDHLVALGITHVEVMPVAAFAGDRGWGYDGVAPFAVQESYGGPDALKRFVDACHARGLSVILDVVYNHFGPVGSYANKFGPYLTTKHKTPWGDAVNLDEGGSDEVRRFFCDNAAMWLRVRIACDHSIDEACRRAAYSYQHDVPGGAASEVAVRITNAQ